MSYISWDSNPEIFTIPWLDHPIRWYGICFVIGFLVAYFIVTRRITSILERSLPSIEAGRIGSSLTDRLAWFLVIGTIVGARLGYVIFYGWPNYRHHPIDILKVWEGGLASHGGAIGIIVALLLFRWRIKTAYPMLTFLTLLDSIVIPTGFVGFCIRIGNFMNQEILGTLTDVPWAVVFGHPADGSMPAPRHPVQLYEAGCYLLIFLVLMVLWRRSEKSQKSKKTKKSEKSKTSLATGTMTGLFFVLTFGTRFVLEFFKTRQSLHLSEGSDFSMGQMLSIPFILIGVVLLVCAKKGSRDKLHAS